MTATVYPEVDEQSVVEAMRRLEQLQADLDQAAEDYDLKIKDDVTELAAIRAWLQTALFGENLPKGTHNRVLDGAGVVAKAVVTRTLSCDIKDAGEAWAAAKAVGMEALLKFSASVIAAEYDKLPPSAHNAAASIVTVKLSKPAFTIIRAAE